MHTARQMPARKTQRVRPPENSPRQWSLAKHNVNCHMSHISTSSHTSHNPGQCPQTVHTTISTLHACARHTAHRLQHVGNERLARLGFAVWTFDAHGHGYSEPADELSRHTLLRFEHIIVDAEQFLQEVVQPWRDSQPDPVPLYISGPSLGGLVVRACMPFMHVHSLTESQPHASAAIPATPANSL